MAISLGKREAIVELHKGGWTQRRIALSVGVDQSTVSRIVHLYRTTRSLTPRHSIGRPSRLTPRTRRYLARKVLTSRRNTPSSLSYQVTRTQGVKVHPRTIKRALHQEGLIAKKMPRKPRLKPAQKKARLQFAKEYSKKPERFWRSVIFTDESPFAVFPSPGGQWTWTRPGERFLPNTYVETVKHGGGTIHIWGAVTHSGIGWMCRLPEGLDGPTYINILEDELQHTIDSYFPAGKHFIFQQDGASVHRSKVVQAWLKEHPMPILPWPAQSPDLNPIEHVWADVKRRIRENYEDIDGKEKLWEAIQVEWEATPVQLIKNLYASMPRRLQAVIQAKGGVTKY